MGAVSESVERVKRGFARADLGDPRRTRRVQKVVGRLMQAPSASLPVAMESVAELEGAYRIMNNRFVTFEKLLAAHTAETQSRSEEAGDVLVIHDTTPCTFPDVDPKEIGYLPTGKAGFPLHLALVLDRRDWRRPLGVIHAEALFRPSRVKKKGAAPEFGRWSRGMHASANALRGCDRVVHVADCETDSFALLAESVAAERRFVFRVRVATRRGRAIDDASDPWKTVQEVARMSDGVLERDIVLTRRKKHRLANRRKAHPPRNSRPATLSFAAVRTAIPRPHRVSKSYPETLELNLVHVREVDPVPGEPAVEWLLYTTEPVETAEQVAEVVDAYRDRWTIEEFNAALKTGCAYEARNFESRHALLNMLALSLPIASELLWLRSRARSAADAPATQVLNPTQLEILRTFCDYRLPERPTARDALLAVARFGAHLKSNGEPGWKVLYRGMTKLAQYEHVWRAARATPEATHL